MKRTPAIALTASLALAAGCTQGTSSRTTIGQSTTLPALSSASVGLTPAQGPSLTGLDRSHWDIPDVTVSPDGSRAWFWRVHQQQRHHGDHPTAITALDVEPRYGLVDLIGVPVRDVLGDGILMPFRAAHVILSDHNHEHANAYQRSRDGAWRDAETPVR